MGGGSGRGARGFTVLELILAGAIGVVVVGGAYMVYEAGQSTVARSERKADLQQNVRTALDLLIRQMRLAGYLNLGTTPNRVAIGDGTLLVLRGDVQLTGAAGVADTLFGLQAPGTGACPPAPASGPGAPCLVIGNDVYTPGAAQAVIAFNVTNIGFAYFDANDNPLPTPLDGVVAGAFPNGGAAPSPLPGPTTNRDAVRRIQVTLTAVDPNVSAGPGIGSAPEQIVLRANVRLRNVN